MPTLLTFKQVGELLGISETSIRNRDAGTEMLTHIPIGNAQSKRPRCRISRDEVERLIVERYNAARAPFERSLGHVLGFDEGRSRRRR